MSMNIGTTRFAAIQPTTVDLSYDNQQAKQQRMMAHEAMMTRFAHESAIANQIAHMNAANTSQKLNRLA